MVSSYDLRVDGDNRGGAVADEVNPLDVGWLTKEAEKVLRSYTPLEVGEDFEARIDRGVLFDAMAQAQEDSSTGHVNDKQERADSWSVYLLAAHAAYALVFAAPQVFKGNVPTNFYSREHGLASAVTKGSIQDCALYLTEAILWKADRIDLLREGFSARLRHYPEVREFRNLLNAVPAQSESTARTTAPKLAVQLQRMAGQKRWPERMAARVRNWIRCWPIAAVGSCSAAVAAVAILVAYLAWPESPRSPGSVEAMTTEPVIPNVLEVVSAEVVNHEGEGRVTISPWSSPPSAPLFLTLDDPTRNQLRVTIKLRLADIDGPNPGIDLGAQLPAGTVYAVQQTTLQNAINREPEMIPDLGSQPTDVIPLHLDEDKTETVVSMVVSISLSDNPEADATFTPATFRCGYNPAPFTIFLAPSGNQNPNKNLVSVVPLYVLNDC